MSLFKLKDVKLNAKTLGDITCDVRNLFDGEYLRFSCNDIVITYSNDTIQYNKYEFQQRMFDWIKDQGFTVSTHQKMYGPDGSKKHHYTQMGNCVDIHYKVYKEEQLVFTTPKCEMRDANNNNDAIRLIMLVCNFIEHMGGLYK